MFALLIGVVACGVTVRLSAESMEGSSKYLLPTGSSSLRGKTVNNSFYVPQSMGGTVLHNVNMMTGQPAFSVPIASISIGSVSFPIVFSYGGPTRSSASADNERGAASWIGFGWNFTSPFVAANNKGTVALDDDNYVCNLGPYGGGQILQNAAGAYFVASDPAIKVQASLDASGLISGWEFKFTDGVRMKFGSSIAGDLAERFMVRYGGGFVASPYPPSSAIWFKYRWDLSIMDNRPLGASLMERLEFRYQRYDQGITAVTSYTRESYLKEIVAVNHLGKEVEKYSFTLADKGTDEFPAATRERTQGQAIFETKRLNSIEWYLEGSPVVQKRITNLTTTATPAAPSPYKKRILDSLSIEYRNPIGFMVSDPNKNWKFTYDNSNYYGLKTMAIGLAKQEYFYSRPNYANTPWAKRSQQDANPRTLTEPNGFPVQLQLPPVMTTHWENNSQCTDRFCFVTATRRWPSDVMDMEVWKNNGNFFTLAKVDGVDFRKQFSSSYANSLQMIIWNANMILADTKARTFTLYEWDGEMFKARTNILKRMKGSTLKDVLPYVDATMPQQFFLGGDYFLVMDRGFRNACADNDPNVTGSAKVYVVRKDMVNNRFADLNENECTSTLTCVNDSTDYGESYRTNGKCLEYNSTNIWPSASPTMFHIVHQPTSIVLSFAQNADGKTFTPIGSSYSYFGNEQVQAHPNNWVTPIVGPVQSGRDYFLIKSGGVAWPEKVNIMHYNGAFVLLLKQLSYTASFPYYFTKIWTEGNYFLTLSKDASGAILSMIRDSVKYIPATGIPSGLDFTSYQVQSGIDTTKDIRITSHPYAFTFEVYPTNSTADGISKPPVVSGTNYKTNVYEVNPGLISSTGVPFKDVSSVFRDGNSRNFFNPSFSAGDNTVVAMSCTGASNAICTGAAGEKIQFVSAQFYPESPVAINFFSPPQNVYQTWTTGAAYNFNQFRMSAANRVAVISMLNTYSNHAEFRTLQFMGEGFSQTPWQFGSGAGSGQFPVVKTVKAYSALTGNSRGNWTEYGFNYVPAPSSLVSTDAEYNTLSQNFIFPMSSVTTYKGSEQMTVPKAQLMETVRHVLDDSAAPIAETVLDQVGAQVQMRVHDMDGALGSESIKDEASRTDLEYNQPPVDTSWHWPDKLSKTRLKKTTQISWAANRSHHTKVTSFQKYNPNNNQPLFSKSSISGNWYLNQTLFQKTGENRSLPIGSYAFRFGTEPPDATLNGWTDPSMVYNQDNADAKTLSASKKEYDAVFPFLVSKTRAWRDADPTLTDDELKIGDDPIYSGAANWEDRDIVEKRSATGLPLQVRHALSELNGLNRYTANYYEGLSPFPVGTVDNAVWVEAAILMGENYLNGTMDPEGRWLLTTGTASTSKSDKAHTGRWGVKITDNIGVYTKVKLRGASTLTNDYVVSAWILSETSNKPTIRIYRYQANGSTPLDSFVVNDPVGQTFTTNKWQRYEKKLTVSQLKGSQNLFGALNSGDYLLITFGTGATTGRTVDVDDIVCRPANSVFSLTAFDKWHRPIHATGNDHLTRSIEYDIFGNATGMRDDKFRIYSEQSAHAVGEND